MDFSSIFFFSLCLFSFQSSAQPMHNEHENVCFMRKLQRCAILPEIRNTRSICKGSNRLFSCIHSYVRTHIPTVRRKTMDLTDISVVKNYQNSFLMEIDPISGRKILNRVSINMVKVAHKNHGIFYSPSLCR